MPFPTNLQFTDLVQAAAAVVDQAGLRSVLREVVAIACNATGAQYGALGVIGSHSMLSDFIFVGIPDDEAEKIGKLPVGRGVLGTLIRHPMPIVVDDIELHHDFSGFPPNHPPMHTFLGVPVRAGDDVYGNLYLTEKVGGFSTEDKATATALAAIAGGVVSSVRLHERLAELAVFEDRERIARDLHDSVIQDLFATGLSLQALTMNSDIDETASGRLEDAVERIDTAIDTLRTFIFDLRKSRSEANRLELLRQSLRRLCAAGQELSMTIDVLDGLDRATYKSVAAVITESVANACRHSGSEFISVEATRVSSGVHVIVTDQGEGFDPDTAETGMGLANMENRIEALAGMLAVDTSIGAGTTVSFTVPTTFD